MTMTKWTKQYPNIGYTECEQVKYDPRAGSATYFVRPKVGFGWSGATKTDLAALGWAYNEGKNYAWIDVSNAKNVGNIITLARRVSTLSKSVSEADKEKSVIPGIDMNKYMPENTPNDHASTADEILIRQILNMFGFEQKQE